MSSSPFDDVRGLFAQMPDPDPIAAGIGAARPELGRLGALVPWVAGWQRKSVPTADRALVAIFAASHGVAMRSGDDGRPATRARLNAFAAGTTPTNAICAAQGLGFKAFDLAVDLPSGDIADEPAMDERACVATMAFGMESIAGGTDLIAVGEAGQGAELAAAAMLSALYGDAPVDWVDEARSGRAASELVTAALLRHGFSGGDPLRILASLGGRDIAAMVGAILAARLERVPVVLDGFAAAAAAAILHAVNPAAIAHCLAGHVSTHRVHGVLLSRLGLEPLMPGLGIGMEEGVGAALASGLVRTALAIHRDGLRAQAEAAPSRH
jgi:nicotinate-nucleotide--dimethylbenzimidazole phosphoribosyltransferase